MHVHPRYTYWHRRQFFSDVVPVVQNEEAGQPNETVSLARRTNACSPQISLLAPTQFLPAVVPVVQNEEAGQPNETVSLARRTNACSPQISLLAPRQSLSDEVPDEEAGQPLERYYRDLHSVTFAFHTIVCRRRTNKG